jgi:hypothetical protein
MKKKHWIKKATSKHKGAFSADAKRHHMGTEAFARKEEHAIGKTGRRARMALTLSRLRKKRKRRA